MGRLWMRWSKRQRVKSNGDGRGGGGGGESESAIGQERACRWGGGQFIPRRGPV